MQNYADAKKYHSGIYKRLKINDPSVVIVNYRKKRLIHTFENRKHLVIEPARTKSFLDNFGFKENLSFQQQAGNAVPPLIDKAIFEQIIKCTK